MKRMDQPTARRIRDAVRRIAAGQGGNIRRIRGVRTDRPPLCGRSVRLQEDDSRSVVAIQTERIPAYDERILRHFRTRSLNPLPLAGATGKFAFGVVQQLRPSHR